MAKTDPVPHREITDADIERGKARRKERGMVPVDEPAVFSPDRLYRYVLRRRVSLHDGKVLWVMLNPSSADELVEDPTVSRCVNFTRAWGFGTMEIVNLYAYRTPKPERLRNVTDPVGPDNLTYVQDAMRHADKIVVGWGAKVDVMQHNPSPVIAAEMAEHEFSPVHCLGVTVKTGHPRHPLFVRKDKTLEVFNGRPPFRE